MAIETLAEIRAEILYDDCPSLNNEVLIQSCIAHIYMSPGR